MVAIRLNLSIKHGLNGFASGCAPGGTAFALWVRQAEQPNPQRRAGKMRQGWKPRKTPPSHTERQGVWAVDKKIPGGPGGPAGKINQGGSSNVQAHRHHGFGPVVFGRRHQPAAPAGDGNYRKGKYLFRKNCRSCHIRRQKSANVLEAVHVARPMAEWQEAAFARRKRSRHVSSVRTRLAPGGREQDVNWISLPIMYKFAKDSPTPAKCK